MKPDALKNPEAMNLIGYMYNSGRGVEENQEEAFEWYKRAAEAGFNFTVQSWAYVSAWSWCKQRYQ